MTHDIDDFIPSMCNLTRYANKISDTLPWIPTEYLYRPGVAGLHTEIEHFNAYMKPTSTEHALRVQVVKRIESLALQVWPTARVEVFGSYRSGMFLTDSDIDLDVSRVRDRLLLRAFEAELLASNIAEPNSILVIEKASVPIIKLVDRTSKIKVDISFNNYDGIKKIELINEYKRKYPILSKLVMVLKQFLVLHDLNNSYTGGISSFSLILMCINFLQLQPMDKVGESANLGMLLLEFLELYGKEFDYDTSCIRIVNGGQYLPKERALRTMIDGHRPKFLCIEDPLDSRINAARPSYHAPSVKCAFEYAFNLLSNVRWPIQSRNHFSQHNGILRRIVPITKKQIEYRNWVCVAFKHTFK